MIIAQNEMVAVNMNLVQISEAIADVAKPMIDPDGRDPALISMEVAAIFSEKAFHVLQAVKAIHATMHGIAERGGIKFE